MSQSTAVDSLSVLCNLRGTRHVLGRLAEPNRSILFEYDRGFLNSGMQLSPFKPPLQPGLFEDKNRVSDWLPDVFNDSLPDGWGRRLLLMLRFVAKAPQIAGRGVRTRMPEALH